MKVYLDNIVFYLQNFGGISVYWNELVKRIDLTGKQCGMLKVIERDTSILPKSGSQAHWIVECQCKDKTRFSIGSYELRNSRVSCGCLNISKGEFLIKEYLFFFFGFAA